SGTPSASSTGRAEKVPQDEAWLVRNAGVGVFRCQRAAQSAGRHRITPAAEGSHADRPPVPGACSGFSASD
ncbi:MAG: hypothetical protein OER90_09590, partial [Gemmatimonadota bacterium]|nr:hypothetical protein [Gemmatimonadota bacterium]